MIITVTLIMISVITLLLTTSIITNFQKQIIINKILSKIQ